ncbi:MAG: hypothetical protein DMG54_21015 [Acidobacteria bacterium]|nr:MAG: hypothetical protein DMG53_24190 [Acidobacteriota bacterium]PYU41056.1 MAG: hypothetical protein DMG54_21015 [Acidobacteriota bacterium]PYU75683.1 MAG: hypothetical protein DMG52_06520 [Acidobacteriota bacterium]
MNFLADESCARPVIQALCEAGHDVVAIAEIARGATDDQVLEQRCSSQRTAISANWFTHAVVYQPG